MHQALTSRDLQGVGFFLFEPNRSLTVAARQMHPMLYEITIVKVFAAAHAIRLYDGSLEPIHGHNWSVELSVGADALDSMETVMDFHPLEHKIDALLATVHNRFLNEVEPFVNCRVNPTAERVAWWIATEIGKTLPPHIKMLWVKVGEAPGCYATYRPK